MTKRRLSSRWFAWGFAWVMGGVMTAIVTLALTWVYGNGNQAFLSQWWPRWLLAWALAVPVIAILSPWVRRGLSHWITPPGA